MRDCQANILYDIEKRENQELHDELEKSKRFADFLIFAIIFIIGTVTLYEVSATNISALF